MPKNAYVLRIAGVTMEDRQRAIARFFLNRRMTNAKVFAKLEREPDNKYDNHAVKVLYSLDDDNYECVGYIPRDYADIISSMLIDGLPMDIEVDKLEVFKDKATDRDIYYTSISILL